MPARMMHLSHDTAARLDAHAEQRRRADGTPGLAVAITDARQTLRIATYGFANLDAAAPVSPDHRFQIGSISKSFAAIVALQLAEEGRLDLDAPIIEQLPWLELPRRDVPVTSHHLLTHTAGLIAGSLGYPGTRAELYALRDSEPGPPPGTWFHYSNDGYGALGLAIARIAGKPYREVVAERVLQPLGMTASEPAITYAVRPSLAVGYGPLYADRPYHRGLPLAPAAWVPADSAGGAICSTPGDMARYMRMLLGRGQGPQGALLAAESFARMVAPTIERAPGEHYGYGIVTRALDGRPVIAHSGATSGYFAYLLCDLERGLGVTVLSNGPSQVGVIADDAMRVLWSAADEREPPAIPALPDPERIDDAADYAGTYRGLHGTLTVIAERCALFVDYDGRRLRLARCGDDRDRFRADHPDLELAWLEFGRRGGRVVEVFHGARWYAGDGYAGPERWDHPAEWGAYVGHYGSYAPHGGGVRILVRTGRLRLWDPESGFVEDLCPLGGGVFRAAGDDRIPERVQFDRIVEGTADVVRIDGLDYYRCFAPPSPWDERADGAPYEIH